MLYLSTRDFGGLGFAEGWALFFGVKVVFTRRKVLVGYPRALGAQALTFALATRRGAGEESGESRKELGKCGRKREDRQERRAR